MSTTLANIRTLRSALEQTRLTIATPSSLEGSAAASRAMRILDDHVIPRLTAVDAPLLAVIGGSTGSGKSTLLNTLVRENLSTSSVVRPTTRHPVLVHRPEDTQWFMNTTILPSLARVQRAGSPAPHHPGEPAHMELRATTQIPAHLALLDAPDVDSVVEENRDLARQMLDAADMWIFVTTAARYADAVPWQVLAPAAARGVLVAIVLNRVPEGAADAVSTDLRRLMSAQGLADAPVFTIEEHPLTSNMLDPSDTAGLERWLREQAESQERRTLIAQQAVFASLQQVFESSRVLASAFAVQQSILADADQGLEEVFGHAAQRLGTATADGTLLRGEVLSRWQDIVGAADFTRSITRAVASFRDRVTHFVTGKPLPIQPLEDALEAGLATLIEDELMKMRGEVDERWRNSETLKPLLKRVERDLDLHDISLEATQAWQHDLLKLLRTAGTSKRTTARFLAVGVNVTTVALMIVIFASTGGLTGMEVGVAGASAAVSQKLLEAVFGDQAVRAMTKRAQALLLDRLEGSATQVLAPYRDMLRSVAVDDVRLSDDDGHLLTLEDVLDQVTIG